MDKVRIVPVAQIDLRRVPKPWTWAHANRPAIGAYLAKLRGRRPALFNGTLFLLHEWSLENGIFRGALFESDFASFLAWRDQGYPDPSAFHCFGLGALRASDGPVVLGLKARHKARAGAIDFLAGTPEPRDLRDDGEVEMTPSIMRKLNEQTGLEPEDVQIVPGWHVATAGQRIGLVRSMISPERCSALVARVRSHMEMQRPLELADVVAVHGIADLQLAIPAIARAYLNDVVLGRRKSIRAPVFGRAERSLVS
ncbi:MAG TPA: NUDIX hydrolase [Xanthobacteraceae bacterium]|nr:NUDIX hydrolase [Xanthobacteraceae bacterium]